ncbi:MAG: YaiI/YqxD family protein [bacterium]|nr:YaiI/YqxD family protein [bacterium]
MDDLAPFTLYIDGDACPRAVKEVIFKACIKRRVPVCLVANRMVEIPKIRWIEAVVVEAGPDVADAYIAEKIGPGDLSVTADIPLAAQILAKGAMAIDHRGREFTQSNIRERLSIRDFSAELREAGTQTGGPKAFGPKEREAFANALDRCLTRRFNAN